MRSLWSILYKIPLFFKMPNVTELTNFKNVFCIVPMVSLMLLNIIDTICFKTSSSRKVHVTGFG